MQAAAHTALHSDGTKTAKTGKTPIRGVLVSGGTPLKAAHSKGHAEGAPHASMLEALKKALAAAAAHDPHGVRKAALHGSAGHGGTVLAGEAGAALELVQAGGVKNAPAAGKGEQHADGEKAARRKPLHLAHGMAGEAGVSLALAGDLMKTIENTNPARKAVELSETARETAAVHAATRKTAEARVHILDLRHKPVEQASDDSLLALKPPRPVSSDRDAALSLVQRLEGGKDSSAADLRKTPAAAPSPLAGALDRLREMAGSELVRATGIVLRDGGGEIKLVLKPESLGSVRIRMNLVDNAIEGRIVVDSAAVKQVFDGHIDSLMRALTAEGFQTASLQVSVGGQNAENAKSEERKTPPRIRRVSAQGFERNVPGLESMSLGDLLVNLFV